jgi:geranylgeranyl pyrophosphate synthase
LEDVSKDFISRVKHFITTASDLQDWPECWNSLQNALAESEHPSLALPYHAYKAVEGQGGGVIPVTAAWMILVHAAYLIDDLQDGDLERVSRITPPENAMALAIAWIFAAYKMLDDPELPHVTRSRVVDILSQAGFDSSHGQHLELSRNTKNLNTNKQLEAYWQSVIDKSGRIYAAGAAVGAVVGTDSMDCIEALSDYGLSLGVIMQVVDDTRDLWNDAQHSHKFPTLPTILHELATGDSSIHNADHSSPRNVSTDKELEIARSLMEENIPTVISDVLLEWRRRGLESLSILKPSSSRDNLANLLNRPLNLTGFS